MGGGIGANQLGSHLGAINRPAIHFQIAADDHDVEAGEVKNLGDGLVGEKRLEIRRAVAALGELDQVTDSVAGGKLDQAEPVAAGLEAHGFRIDGDGSAEINAFGQIALVEFDGFRCRFQKSALFKSMVNGAPQGIWTVTGMRRPSCDNKLSNYVQTPIITMLETIKSVFKIYALIYHLILRRFPQIIFAA